MKIRSILFITVISVIAFLLITGCDPSKKWEKQERQEIDDYLRAAGDTVYIQKPSGLYYHDITVGTGATPAVGDTVGIRYKGTFLSYGVFGTNYSDTTDLPFVVGSGFILLGLDEGVRYMKVGGIAKMLLPSSLGYGSYGYYTIPGYTPLLFTVELKSVKPGPSRK